VELRTPELLTKGRYFRKLEDSPSLASGEEGVRSTEEKENDLEVGTLDVSSGPSTKERFLSFSCGDSSCNPGGSGASSMPCEVCLLTELGSSEMEWRLDIRGYDDECRGAFGQGDACRSSL
jgi:hypothetical protein